MIKVKGIILFLSCQKYIDNRLKFCKLPKNDYEGWKVIYVIGDFFLNTNYKMMDNLLIVKCEDSYIHLLKKLVLALKYVYQLYDIEEGVLRCGDDLILNEKNLVSFLKSKKCDFYGKSPRQKSLFSEQITDELLKMTTYDDWMVNYYKNHPEDFENPHHNLKGIDISLYRKRPEILYGPAGCIYYISNNCCKILINHMENINFNIFHFDKFSQSYPYTIEDCGAAFILYLNRISFNNYNDWWSHLPNQELVLAYHTNL